MPTIVLNGQTLELTDSEIRDVINQLCRLIERHMFSAPRMRFDRWYDCWTYHNQAGAQYLIRLTLEFAGGVDLPPASLARRLKRKRDQLARMLNPRGVSRFLDEFPRWQRDCALFCNSMVEYQDGIDMGGQRTVRALELTRDGSFVLLQVCAAISTAGASTAASGAAVATTSAGTALARQAATAFVVREMQNSATRLGRSLAGAPPTTAETVDEITTSILMSASGAVLGQIAGTIMRPMGDTIGRMVEQEVRRGSLGNAIALETINNQVGGLVENAIRDFIGQNENDFRQLVRNNRAARDQRSLGQQVGNEMMRNRNFRRRLETRLERAATRR